MDKTAYISTPEVKQFIEFFADKIFGNFEHRYLVRQTGKEWSSINIRDAALKYQWPWRGLCNTLCDNARELDRLQINLRNALKPANSVALVNSSLDVFKWGGVLNGNKNRVIVNMGVLVGLYSGAISQLHLAGDDKFLGKVWNMNSGFSKVYSLLSDDMIIYDSRVGAALGFLVKHCATQHKWGTIPEELLFPYASPRNAVTAVKPLNRNPGSYHGVSFPSFSGRPDLQAVFMIRASWIVEAVIKKVACIKEKELKCGQVTIPKQRFIEAGLFMIGYDLSANLTPKNQLPKKISVKSKGDECQYQTLCQKSEFNAGFSLDSSSLLISKRKGKTANIKIDDIIAALLWLLKKWGTVEFFPLDNSATEVRKGSGKNGLGTALFEVTSKTFNPPDASSVATLLYNLGVLDWDQNRRFSKFIITGLL